MIVVGGRDAVGGDVVGGLQAAEPGGDVVGGLQAAETGGLKPAGY